MDKTFKNLLTVLIIDDLFEYNLAIYFLNFYTLQICTSLFEKYLFDDHCLWCKNCIKLRKHLYFVFSLSKQFKSKIINSKEKESYSIDAFLICNKSLFIQT